MDGLHITFDEAFDSGSWPGPLTGGKTSAFGDAWLGPMGLVQLLETRLGLAATYKSEFERAIEIIAHLESQDAYYSASLSADPLGTASRLVAHRDELWLHGWRGQGASLRIAALHAATKAVSRGRPDRLQAITDRLQDINPGIASLTHFEQPNSGGWRDLFAALDKAGVQRRQQSIDAATGRGDLQGARDGKLKAQGDGSLQLVRAYGPMACAEHLAAFLANLPSLDDTVVIGADSVLDSALASFGVPITGASHDEDSASQILPLVIEMGLAPQDPSLAHELMTLAVSPIPKGLARKLTRALRSWPALGNEDWNNALKEGLEAIPDEAQRKKVERRVQAVFCKAADQASLYPTEKLIEKCEAVRQWAQNRSQLEAAENVRLGAVAIQCSAFASLLQMMNRPTHKLSDVRRLLLLAKQQMPTAKNVAQAGLASVARPESIAGPCRTVIWWNFQRSAAASVPRSFVSKSEREALTAFGVPLPTASEQALRIARLWRRPLLLAKETLVLVCPKKDAQGQAAFPHPLWDEVEGAAHAKDNAPGAARKLVVEHPLQNPAPKTVEVAQLSTPSPTFSWTAPQLDLPDKNSASGVEKLIGCSFQWALHYLGGMRGAFLDPIQDTGPLVQGKLAHKVFEHVIKDGITTLDAAQASAEAHFDAMAPSLVAKYFVPGHENERAASRHVIGQAARIVAHALEHGPGVFRSTEVEYQRQANGVTFFGYPDLLIENPGIVVDYKLGSAGDRENALKNGTAVQLAVYAFISSQNGQPLPEAAYLIINNQKLYFSGAAGQLAGSVTPGGPSMTEVWKDVLRSVTQRKTELAEGRLLAPPNASGDETDSVLQVIPKCEYCSFSTMCGQRFGSER